MGDYSVKHIDDMEASFGGAFKKVRAELGVTSFGVQVIEMPPDVTQYPEHDHAESGQEELFGVLDGSGRIAIGEDEVPLEPGVFVRVGPRERRKIYSGADGLRLIAVGGIPGRPYEIAAASELGAS